MDVLNLTVKLNIVSAIEVARLVVSSVVAENARIKNLGKMFNLIIQQVVNVENQDVQKNTVNAFKMERNVGHNVNVRTVVT